MERSNATLGVGDFWAGGEVELGYADRADPNAVAAADVLVGRHVYRDLMTDAFGGEAFAAGGSGPCRIWSMLAGEGG